LIHSRGGIAVAAHPYDKLRRGVKDLCWQVGFDAIEINGHCLIGNSQAERIAKEKKKPLIGGSDAHALSGIGTIATESEAGSVDELLKNIKEGKCGYVAKKNKMAHAVSIIRDRMAKSYNGARKL